MAALLVTADSREIEPLLLKHEPCFRGGHPRVPDRVCLAGILFMLKTGLNGRTSRRRWAAAG